MYNKRMKITESDYNRLNTILQNGINTLRIQSIDCYSVSKTRYTWDVYHAIMDNLQLNNNVSDYLFMRGLSDYLNDSHIETVLKDILL